MAESGNILAIDIGGSHIKCIILNSQGEGQMAYNKVPTPPQAKPADVLDAIGSLANGLTDYTRISVGFPGYVRNGIVFTAPNLGKGQWDKVDLGQQISNMLQKPVRLINDADQLGLGVVSGRGYELVATLGTGFGTAILMDGYLLPHIELSHHPVTKEYHYDDYIGAAALKEEGKAKWNKRVGKVLEIVKTVFNYDRLYLGGGNIDKLTLALDSNIHTFTNQDGIKGGARLWDLKEGYHITTNNPVPVNANIPG